jgi:hypothetical protein
MLRVWRLLSQLPLPGRRDKEASMRPIAIGSDEAGFRLKEELRRYLETAGYEVTDYGCHSTDPVDYPDVAIEVATAVAAGTHDRAVLICGTGIGMAIAANKVPGVYSLSGRASSARSWPRHSSMSGSSPSSPAAGRRARSGRSRRPSSVSRRARRRASQRRSE